MAARSSSPSGGIVAGSGTIGAGLIAASSLFDDPIFKQIAIYISPFVSAVLMAVLPFIVEYFSLRIAVWRGKQKVSLWAQTVKDFGGDPMAEPHAENFKRLREEELSAALARIEVLGSKAK